MQIPAGYYDSVKHVVEEMNSVVAKYFEPGAGKVSARDGLESPEEKYWPTFRYNPLKRKVFVTLPPSGYIELDDHLATLIGFGPDKNPLKNNDKQFKTFGGNRSSDLQAGLHSLYVYCDVLENVPVGDTEAPLLRIISGAGDHGSEIHQTFDPPRYIPLQKKHFDSIEIDIRDDHGEPVSFESGKLYVTLHFKRANFL